MIKSFVAAVALTIGLAGYAFAQETVPGAPAGTAPVTPAPGTPAPIPGMMTPPRRGRTCITMCIITIIMCTTTWLLRPRLRNRAAGHVGARAY